MFVVGLLCCALVRLHYRSWKGSPRPLQDPTNWTGKKFTWPSPIQHRTLVFISGLKYSGGTKSLQPWRRTHYNPPNVWNLSNRLQCAFDLRNAGRVSNLADKIICMRMGTHHTYVYMYVYIYSLMSKVNQDCCHHLNFKYRQPFIISIFINFLNILRDLICVWPCIIN